MKKYQNPAKAEELRLKGNQLYSKSKFGEAVKGYLARKEDRPTIAKLADGAGGHLQHCWHSPPTG